MKKNVLVIFGGRSAEHDISILTGIQSLYALENVFYNVFPLYVSSGGVFYFGKVLKELEFFKNFNQFDKKLCQASFLSGKPYLIFKKGKKWANPMQIDCAVLCLHGRNGEDGTMQGLLELCDIPYTSCGVMSSAVCMDKIIAKDIFKANNFPIVSHNFFTREEFEDDKKTILQNISESINFPNIVKPSNLGSSIGISKCQNKKELENAIELALKYDSRVIVEKAVQNLMEINCAVMGTTISQTVSKLEQPISYDKILTFDEKYIGGNLSEQKSVLQEKEIDLSTKIKKQIKELSLKAYKTLRCSGVVRIDWLVDSETKEFFINEVNTIPGSLAFYLFDNLSHFEVIDQLVSNAYREKTEQQKNSCSFSSTAILNYLDNKSGSKTKIRKRI